MTDESSLSEELSVLKAPPGRDKFAHALEGKLLELEMSASASGLPVDLISFPLKKAAILLSAAALLIGGGAFAYMASQEKDEPPKVVTPKKDVPVVEAPLVTEESTSENSELASQPEVRDAAPSPTELSAAPRNLRKDVKSKKLEVDLAVPQLKERDTNESEGKLKPLGESMHSIEGEQIGNESRSVRRPGETGE